MKRLSSVLGVAVLLLAGCGAGARRPSAGLGAGLGAFGRCDSSHVDGPSAESFVSTRGIWLRVVTIDLSSAQDKTLGKTEPFAGEYDVVGGDADVRGTLGSDSTASLTMHGSIAREIRDARLLTPDVYAHSGGNGDPHQVEFAVAFTPDDFAFLGECQDRLLTTPLRERFGAAAREKIRSFVGKRGAEVAAAFPKPSAQPSSVVILNPDTAPAELMASLTVISFSLSAVPSSWIGPYTICTRIAQGWSDCIDLSQRSTSSVAVDAYFDPEHPEIEIWLADQSADLARPLARLATADLVQLTAEARHPLKGLQLVGTLSGQTSPQAAAQDPAQASASFARLALTKSY